VLETERIAPSLEDVFISMIEERTGAEGRGAAAGGGTVDA
jgi:hypothetical protein